MPTLQSTLYSTPQASPFLERLLRFLIPYFTGVSADIAVARAEALETLVSYGARTRAELLCAVQIIIFSFAALDTLAEANMDHISPAMRIRFRGCANNLNRNCQKNELILAKRLACDAPKTTNPRVEPIDDVPEDVAAEIMELAKAAIQDCREHATVNQPAANRFAATHTTQSRPQLQRHPEKRTRGGDLLDRLAAEMAMPIPPKATLATASSATTPASGA